MKKTDPEKYESRISSAEKKLFWVLIIVGYLLAMIVIYHKTIIHYLSE